MSESKLQRTDVRESTRSGEEDCLWTVTEAAQFLNLSPGTLYHLISQRRIPVVRISSRCVRLSRRALLEWVENLTQQAEELPDGGIRSSVFAVPKVSDRGSSANKK